MNEPKRQDDRELQLCEYLDGQLGRRQRRQMEQQLEQDDELREQLRQYASLDGLLGQLGEREVEGFDFDQQRAEIVAAAERKALLGQKNRRRVFIFRPLPASLAAAASVLIVVGLAYLFWNQPNTVVSNNSPAPEVSVRMVHPVEPAAAASTGTVMMRLARPSGQSAPAAKASQGGTVTVSAGGAQAGQFVRRRADDDLLIEKRTEGLRS